MDAIVCGHTGVVVEILPGVQHWTAAHPKIGIEVSSHWVPSAGAVIDPVVSPDEGLDPFREQPPERVLLSNRHHLRDSERFAAELGCSIHCSRPGLHEFDGRVAVEGFDFGDEVAAGIEGLEVGAICPDETALLIRDAGVLLVADGIMHYSDELEFVSDWLLGDDPEGVKRSLRASYSRLLDRDFDNLLFAHGTPLVGGGKRALAAFCAA
jgi:glyoxylase-like metal-dependent hydrolase (beta-lactamase superfamily II)